MTAKSYLSQAYWIRDKIADNKKTIEMLDETKADLKATDYSKEPVRHSRANEANYATIIQKIYDLQLEIRRESDRLADVEKEIRTKIRGIEEADEQAVLYKRYILNMNLTGNGSIAEDMGLSERWVLEKHKRALKTFAKKYGFTS